MTRRLLVSVLLASLFSTTLVAGLLVGEPRRVSIPPLEPFSTSSDIELTGSDGTFLATWPRHTGAVRLDRDGDALDRPPLALPAPPRPTAGRSGEAAPDGSGWLLASRAYPNETESSILVERIASNGAHAFVGEIVIPRSFGPFEFDGGDGRFAALYGIIGGVTTGVTTFDASARKTGEVVLDGITVALAHRGGRFAALLRDRVVLLGADASVERSIPLPPLAEPRAIAPVGDTFVIGAVHADRIVLYRIRKDSAVETTSFASGRYTELALDSSGAELLVLFSALPPDDPGPPPVYAARVGTSGSVEGPVSLGGTAMGLAVEGDDSGWLLGWTSAGPEASGSPRTLRIDRPDSLAAPADDVDPVVWKAPAEAAQAIATSGERALAVWWRGTETRGALLDRRGGRVSPDDLVFPVLSGVTGRERGFLAYRAHDARNFIATAVSLNGTVHPDPVVIAQSNNLWSGTIECAGALCLAAWITGPVADAPTTLRFARIEGQTVLDPGGIVVVHPVTISAPYLDIASDGTQFLVAWSRNVEPGGSIVSAALVDPASPATFRTFDVLASNEEAWNVHVVWNGTTFEIIREGAPHRIVRIRPDGSVIEGEASGWAGWPLEMGFGGVEAFRICGSSWFANGSLPRPVDSVVYEIEDRTAVPAAALPLRVYDVACFDGRSCLALGDDWRGGRFPPPGTQVYVVPMTCARERPAGR